MSRKNPPPSRPVPAPIDDEPTEIGRGLGFGGGDDVPSDEDFALEDLEGLEDLPADDERTHPGFPLPQDTFEDSSVRESSKVVLDPRNQGSTGRFRSPFAAPEVTQGPWRERAFIPRGVVPREQIIASMQQALQIAAMQKGTLDRVRIALRAELMPLLRQVVEQAGGDGLDAWLGQMIAPPGKPARDPLLKQIAAHMERFGRAAQPQALLAEAKALVETCRKALFAPAPKKISLQYLEEEFEGRIELDTLMSIFFTSDEELEQRRQQVERTLESMRVQMRSMTGSTPEGLMWNFSRLKVEKRVVEAEQKRRTRPAAAPPSPPRGPAR